MSLLIFTVFLLLETSSTACPGGHKRRNRAAEGARALYFSQIIKQSAPFQLKKLPVFVYESAPVYMCPYSLNDSYVPLSGHAEMLTWS